MIKTHILDNSNPRGSEWNKWDLHVHTPASVINHYGGDPQQDETWKTYISALEELPAEIKAIGINDYFFLEGYRRVIEAKKAGQLPNINLILPVVELRIAAFVGHRDFRKINYHVIFSNELTPDQIEAFFLNQLGVEFKLDDGNIWSGKVCHREGLIELGKAIRQSTPESKRPNESDLLVGFCNAAFPLDTVHGLISQTIFKDKTVTAVGLAEWDQWRWDGGSGALKKTIINGADLAFTASPSLAQYQKKLGDLRQQQVNSRLLDCSDAHFYASSKEPNRLGNVFSWLKADLTFRGLRRVIQRFDDRIFIGGISEIPPKLEQVKRHKTKYIQSIKIQKKSGSELDEVWFDCEIPLNSELVAIIGNQGNGKSALTDIIALCGNSKTDKFSFLNENKFCNKQNKAGEFEAILTWEDGTKAPKPLDASINTSDVERVRYVPQSFFEAITNETIIQEGGQFYGEIKKAIFSHIAESDHLDCSDLDTLIERHTKEDQRSLNILRQELKDLNSRIVVIEKVCAPEEVARLQNEIEAKKTEIKAHQSTTFIRVDEPSESVATNRQIEFLRDQEDKIQKEIDIAESNLRRYKEQRLILRQTKSSIETEHQRLKGVVSELQRNLRENGLNFDVAQLILMQVDILPLITAIGDLSRKISKIEQQINPEVQDSLFRKKKKARKQRKDLQGQLKQASQEYQIYQNQIADWQQQLNKLMGDTEIVGTLKWQEQQLRDTLENKPLELVRLEDERRKKCKEIHTRLMQLVQKLQELTRRVQDYIKSDLLTREKFRLKFAIELVERDVANRLFAIIKQGRGTFRGVQEGRERLHQIAGHYDFSSADDTVKFAERVLDNLKRNHNRTPPTIVELPELLKQGFKVKDVYNLLFGLEYLHPEYSLALNEKPLKQLSPGERGILLLIFYLIVDRGDEPLIIDQPEGNLNNQSIFDNLVPVFKKAKKQRQIIVVTHNPNLAVVCDAEQIIHAQLNFQDGNRILYESGALENPIFNKLSLDVLEGTSLAFNARRMTYDTYS